MIYDCMDSIVLASRSPRRREILQNLNIPFIVFPANTNERELLGNVRSLRSLVIRISKSKVQKAAAHFSNGLIVGVDTMVYFNHKLLGQPKSAEEARTYLKMLSSNRHLVFSGITVKSTGENRSYSSCSITEVHFSKLTNREIDAYIEGGEWAGKAGAYAIQGQAALFVARIDGSFYNVMGLPVEELYRLLNRFDYFTTTGVYRPVEKM